jgi:aspartyl-tRNA(Asn)/glutamyl-tRNA(Gln) amidotransferase subunit A
MHDELFWLSATDLLRHYRRRELSPVEVIRTVLARIERLEPQLNAFAWLDAKAALAAARESEARWQRNVPLGLLDGVPLSVKDLLLTRGWPTRRGSRTVAAEGPWEHDAPAVARAREHGAVLLGKTTTTEFGLQGFSESPLTGVTKNPWHPGYTTGGSSAGAVAATAAGLGPLALGTDGGGSIRVPSAYTGVVGFKPTFGRVPTYPAGFVGVPPHVGPITRTVEDAALLFTVIAQPDARDPFAAPAGERDYRDALGRSWHRVRIGVSTLGYADIDPEIRAAFERAARVFAELGATLEAADPELGSPASVLRVLFAARAAHTVAGLTPDQRELLDPDVERSAREGERLTALEYLEAEAQRVALAQALARYHEQYDLLLTPTTAWTAPPLDAQRPQPSSPFTFPFSLTRQPAISVPAGSSRAGLPIGIQIVGRPFDDGLVLAAAHAFESRAPFPRLGELR